MKSNKGFTLIELLAVIVILVIIALIATPLVLKYIEKSRINSKIVSAQNYIKAVENALVTYSITNKGKSYPEGCYAISTLDTDLDINIKGDIPTEGKVCIENNKIEKAIVKYPDNKIIKYEDDKSVVSDEETFESFNIAIDYIIDEDLEFVYDESEDGYVATISITKEIFEQFKEAMDYDFIIDNGNVETITGTIFESDLVFYSSADDISKLYGVLINGEEMTIFSRAELVGIHNVKIRNPRLTEERTFFTISPDGYMSILGYDFIKFDAHILIKDEDGAEYYNNTIELMEHRGFIGADRGCRDNIPKLPDVYTALTNGKTIMIEVTQTVDGKEIISTVSRNLNSMVYWYETYFSKLHFLPLQGTGC